MAKQWKSVKTNILLGYITLVLIATATVWLIYNETLDLYVNQIDVNPVNDKILFTNSILTDLHEADGYERSYLQTGNNIHFTTYNNLMDSIAHNIDSLGSMAGISNQQVYTDSIQQLLIKKKQNLKELVSIKNAASSEKLYEQAMLRLANNKDSINHILSIYKSVNTTKDSIFFKQDKKRFFERLIHAFSPQVIPDSTLKIVVNESVQVDSIFNRFNPSDSIQIFLSSIIEDVKKESLAFEKKMIEKEQEILANDQTITLQIRQMLSSLHNEEIIHSLSKVDLQQKSIGNITKIVIILGAAALLVVIGFLVLILKDISRSQHYRQNLEKEKAYSESLLKSKEQFMLSITHDLKSPLGSIIGFSQLIEREKITEQQKHYVKSIGQSAGFILRLINDLLDFARLESGQLKIEVIRFNLKSLIDEVVSGFYPLASAKNLHFKIDTESLTGNNYLADPARIKQVLGNLISNAVKFTDHGRITISGSVINSKSQTDWVQLDVIDTGIGISPENAQLIFEEFSRVPTNNNKQYEGSGLGLAITKRIVELMNGTIKLNGNNKIRGSHFTVVLPLHKQNGSLEKKQALLESFKKQGIKKIDFQNEKILLVDDDPMLLEMSANVLRNANLDVTAYSEPRESLKAINSQSFDLLITDIQMPRMDGFELLYFYKKSFRPTRAIAVTGESPRYQIFKDAGFSAVLQKPFQPEDLLIHVSRVLNGKNKNAEAAAINKINTEYTIDGIKAFAQNDPANLQKILISFNQSTNLNVELFRKQLQQEDFDSLSKLAHKMLPMFKQLEVQTVVELLSTLEQNKFESHKQDARKKTANQALLHIEGIMEKIREDHQIPLSGRVML